MTQQRLNRFLARSGVASRRAADRLIASGAVLVNGARPHAAGVLVDPDRDRVTVEGREVHPPTGHAYIVLNKPAGHVVTASDPQGRPTALGIVASERRLFSVGRLDRDTRGLLLLTDDGDLAHRLAHPRHGLDKEYAATVEGQPSEMALQRLREGVELDDGRTAPARVDRLAPNRIRLVIHERRKRQVRRMLEAVGHPVTDLVRTAFGPLRARDLAEGQYRDLTQEELAALRKAVKL